jgi:hypothetical protein
MTEIGVLGADVRVNITFNVTNWQMVFGTKIRDNLKKIVIAMTSEFCITIVVMPTPRWDHSNYRFCHEFLSFTSIF